MESRDFETIHTYTVDDAIEDGTVIALTAPPERIKPLHEIGSMDEYLQNYGKILGKKAISALAPMHVPGRDPLPDFSELLREPFPCQQHVCAAAVQMLNREGSGFIVGEMGTGKTLLGMTGVHLHARQSRNKGGYGGNYRAIILAPDHLLAKWEREIKETIPGASVTRFGPRRAHDDESDTATKRRTKGKKSVKHESGSKQTLRDFLKLLDFAQPNGRWRKPAGAEWFVLGRNQAKWLSDWAGLADETTGFNGLVSKGRSSKTVVVERVAVTDEYGRGMYDKRGKPVMRTVMARVHYCPSCGQVIRDKKGVPVGEASLSAKPKGATQKRCIGRFMVALPNPENPQERPATPSIPCRDGTPRRRPETM